MAGAAHLADDASVTGGAFVGETATAVGAAGLDRRCDGPAVVADPQLESTVAANRGAYMIRHDLCFVGITARQRHAGIGKLEMHTTAARTRVRYVGLEKGESIHGKLLSCKGYGRTARQ